MSNLAFMVRAFRHRDYRLFFAGQLVSMTGSWMSMVATSWLVYRITGSTLKLGLVGFAGQLPAFLLSPVAGIAVDRWENRRLFMTTQALSMLQVSVLAWLTLSGRVTFPLLAGLSVFQGLVNAFDMPVRQSFVNLIVEREHLGNAIALNASMFHAGRMIGPAAAGLVIARTGEGVCFLIDAASFLALLVALALIPARGRAPRREEGAGEALKEGFRYTLGSPAIRSVLVLMALLCLVGFPYTVLLPPFAGRELKGGADTLGLLMAASGLGAFAGSLWLAARRSVVGLDAALGAAAAAFGLALMGVSWSRSTPACLAFMTVMGAGFLVVVAGCNTIIQTIVDDDKRGRVMSLYMMAFLGAAPLGSLLAGAFAERAGPARALAVCGAASVATGLWFLRRLPETRREIHPIYGRLGLLQEPVLPV